jgi:hypothetical protein
MRTSAIAIAAVLLIAAATYTAEAVSCGSFGDMPLSGCLTCEPAAVNFTGKDGWHGFKGSHLHQDAATARHGGGHGGGKPPGHGGNWPPKGETSMTLPNCTACDTANNFTAMPPITSSKWAHPNIGRCGESDSSNCQQHSATLSPCVSQTTMCCCTADTTSLHTCSTGAAASKPWPLHSHRNVLHGDQLSAV